jgi:hypothetical protein
MACPAVVHGPIANSLTPFIAAASGKHQNRNHGNSIEFTACDLDGNLPRVFFSSETE